MSTTGDSAHSLDTYTPTTSGGPMLDDLDVYDRDEAETALAMEQARRLVSSW